VDHARARDVVGRISPRRSRHRQPPTPVSWDEVRWSCGGCGGPVRLPRLVGVMFTQSEREVARGSCVCAPVPRVGRFCASGELSPTPTMGHAFTARFLSRESKGQC
jgi:hypothetical protein